MCYMLIILVIVIVSIITGWHVRLCAYDTGYYKGRGDGWDACENLALSRARKESPELHKKVLDLLQ